MSNKKDDLNKEFDDIIAIGDIDINDFMRYSGHNPKTAQNLQNLRIIETVRGADKESIVKSIAVGYTPFFKEVERRFSYGFPAFAAYLLPNELTKGERVILKDLIEFIVGALNHGTIHRLDSIEAVWDGEKFIVDMDSFSASILMG